MPPLLATDDDPVRIAAWRCIGCGKIEAPKPCIGVCSDRKVELVEAETYEQVLRRLEQAQAEYEAAVAFIRVLAHSRPHGGRWEESYRQLREQARRIVSGPDMPSPETV